MHKPSSSSYNNNNNSTREEKRASIEIWTKGGREQVKQLIECSAYESAEILCSFIANAPSQQSAYSVNDNNTNHQRQRQQNNEITELKNVVNNRLSWRLRAIDCYQFGAAFKGKGELVRALSWFERSLSFEENFERTALAESSKGEAGEEKFSSFNSRGVIEFFKRTLSKAKTIKNSKEGRENNNNNNNNNNDDDNKNANEETIMEEEEEEEEDCDDDVDDDDDDVNNTQINSITKVLKFARDSFNSDAVKFDICECHFKLQDYLQCIQQFEATEYFASFTFDAQARATSTTTEVTMMNETPHNNNININNINIKSRTAKKNKPNEKNTATQTKQSGGENSNEKNSNNKSPLMYHLFKAKAHHALGHTQKAMKEYEFVFSKDASYLECVPNLISLSPVGGQRAREIFKMHCEKNTNIATTKQHAAKYDQLVGGSASYRKTINCWIDAMEGLERNSVRQASPHVQKLVKERPKQPEILIMRARWDGLRGKPDKALEAYEAVSQMDNKRVANMEKYAAALRDSREGEKLKNLAQRLFAINENACESWVASAMASDLSKDKEKALAFAQKAKDLNPRNQVALVTLGECAMKLKKTELAIASFRSANEVKPSLKSYHGLVKAYSAAGRRKEAIESAQAATELNTHSAFAASLLGDAHKRVSGDIGLKRTKDAFAKALQMDPSLLRAAFGLADACMRDSNDVERAKFVIKNILENHPPKDAQSKVMLHVKYAGILFELNEKTEALLHFQNALGIEPNNQRAKEGLEKCEKSLKTTTPGSDAADAEMDEDEEEE